jgi:hypothetical protein
VTPSGGDVRRALEVDAPALDVLEKPLALAEKNRDEVDDHLVD